MTISFDNIIIDEMIFIDDNVSVIGNDGLSAYDIWLSQGNNGSVNDFLKRHSLIKITKTGIERLGASVINLAQHEDLDGHANSIKIRLNEEK